MIAFDIDLSRQPFFSGLEPRHMKKLDDCAQIRRFEPQDYIFREGDPARSFYLICGGMVHLLMPMLDDEPIEVGTVGEWEALGWSWLMPPYRWHFDAKALTPVEAVVFDAETLRARCDEDPALGYELMKRFAGVLLHRLQATRLKLVEDRLTGTRR